ncbi:MAG: alpha/beta fold hydrolase [Spirochaetia bacterium]|nr:alpha/beta fold hydrolase [Spirochaetia bacterium]
MNFFIVIILLAAVIYYFGWYSLPEKIDPLEYQDLPAREDMLRGADPFFFRGASDTAFLLVHGYESTPFTLKNLGKQLHESGHSVFAPLLPGHGTSIKQLAKTRYEHWYEAVRRVYIKERMNYKKFFIIGFSLGGNLSLRLAVQYRVEMPPSALILISTPVVLNGVINGALVVRDWRLIFSGIARFFLGPVTKRRDLVSSDIINPTVTYNEAYVVAPLHSFRTNVVKIKKYLKYITVPICIIHASNDKTIDVENAHYILRKVKSVEKQAFIFKINEEISTRHEILTHETIRDKVFNYIFSFLNDYDNGFQFTSRLFLRYKNKGKNK